MPGWVDFRELRSKLRFDDLLKYYGASLRINGTKAVGVCPLPTHQSQHGRKPSRSFSAHVGKGIWQCFACGAKGNVLDFAVRMEGLSPSDVQDVRRVALELQERFLGGPRRSLGGRGGPEPSHGRPALGSPSRGGEHKNVRRPVKSPEQNESAGAQGQESQAPVLVNVPLDFELKGLDADHPYLLKRGFTPETIRHFGLGYCTRGAFKGRLAIPIRDGDGALVGYAGRLTKDEEVSDANPKYKFPAARERDGAIHRFDKSLLLYNAHALEKPTQCVIVVQGFSSVWWLWQHGYRCTVALMGPECSEAQAVFLKQRLSANGHVWVLTDGDELGDRCAGEVFRKVGDLRPVRYVALRRGERPSDCSVEDLSALLGG